MAINVILEYGEFGYDSTTKTAKIGDGFTIWEKLDTFNKTPLVNDLLSHRTDAALTAYQGNILNHDKISYLNIVDNLRNEIGANTDSQTTFAVTTVLSGYQGKVLNDKIESYVTTLRNEYKSADTTLKNDISTMITTYRTDLGVSITNNLNPLLSRVSVLEGQITSLTATTGTDTTSQEVIAARTDSTGVTKPTLAKNVQDIHSEAIKAQRVEADMVSTAMIMRELVRFHDKEILALKLGGADSVLGLQKQITELRDKVNVDSDSIVNHKEDLDNIFQNLDSICVDLTDSANAIEKKFYEIEKALLSTMFDNYVSSLAVSRIISDNEKTVLSNEFDTFLTVQIIKRLIEDLDRNLAIEKFDVELFAHSMQVFMNTVNLNTDTINSKLDSLFNSTNSFSSNFSSLQSLTNQLVSRVDSIYNTELKNTNKSIDKLETDHLDFANTFRLITDFIDKRDYDKITSLEVNLVEISNSISKSLSNINSSITSIFAKNNNYDNFNSNVNTSLNIIESNLDDLNKSINVIDIDNQTLANSLYVLMNDIQDKIYDIQEFIKNQNIDTMAAANAISRAIEKTDDSYVRELDKYVNIDLKHTMEILSYFIDQTNTQLHNLNLLLDDLPITVTTVINDSSRIEIEKPRIGVINITGINSMPTSKTEDSKAILEFWDMKGNYFKKKVFMAAQGSSSMGYIKKNFKFDLFNDEWGGDSFTVKFGDWVPQDSFHCKAYYTDAFRGIGVVAYTLFNDILESRGIEKDRPWKKSLIDYELIKETTNGMDDINDLSLQFDTGARNLPDGFPVLVYLNKIFYGLFSLQLKKSRENYHQDKSNPKHIHLDGVINQSTLWDGNVNWTQFEIRNPKNLYTMDGSKYDGDYPSELIDSSSSQFNTGSSKEINNKLNTSIVKESILDLSKHMGRILEKKAVYDNNPSNDNLNDLKETFETYFDVENQIDYLIFSDVLANRDGFSKNWQWTTYDGVKWYVNVYDCDMTFGGHFQGTQIQPVLTGHINTNTHLPCYYIITYYKKELEERYKELRNMTIISVDHIMNILKDWTSRIGVENYEKEYTRWPDSPCNGNNVINEEYWILRRDGEGNPEKVSSSDYVSTKQYQPGDIVSYGLNSVMGYYKFACIKDAENKPPISQFKYHDSIYRIKKWITKSIENMDRLYNYDFYAWSISRLSQTVEEIENKDYKEISKIATDLTEMTNILQKLLKSINDKIDTIDNNS